MNWNFEIGSSTPRKKNMDQRSTGCIKESVGFQSFRPCQNNNPIRRFGKQLPQDYHQELEQSIKSIKRFKIDEQPYFIDPDIIPFSILEDHEIEMDVEEPNLDNIQHIDKKDFLQMQPRLKKKHSICEADTLPSLPPLYRINSTLVINNEREVLEFLGDNTFVKELQHQPSDSQRVIPKYQISDSSRLGTDYYLLENLGRTHLFQGNVFKCLSKLDRMVYIIKQYTGIYSTETPEFSIFRTIMRTSIKDKSSCLVKFFFSWVENSNLYLVYEPATFTIEKLNADRMKLSQNQIRMLLSNVCKSLEYLGSNSINHLNIKPSNILNCRGKFKLMDFIASKHNFSLLKNYKNKYMAPQLQYPALVNSNDLWKADVFSLGMVIIQNIVGTSHPQQVSQIKERLIMKRKLQSAHQYSPNLVKLLLQMTNNDSRLRPTFEQIVGIRSINTQYQNKKTRKYSL